MSNVGILFLIFGILVFLVGLYMFNGHKLGIMEGRAAFQNLTIDKWKNIGKYTLIVSGLILAFALIAFIFDL